MCGLYANTGVQSAKEKTCNTELEIQMHHFGSFCWRACNLRSYSRIWQMRRARKNSRRYRNHWKSVRVSLKILLSLMDHLFLDFLSMTDKQASTFEFARSRFLSLGRVKRKHRRSTVIDNGTLQRAHISPPGKVKSSWTWNWRLELFFARFLKTSGYIWIGFCLLWENQ